ncbi:MAG: molybdopterin molybdotransferase MoeA [bacterium]|nr:MAG: molybdopterin molybdotransferase MoeA [bacterium]
MIPFEEAFRTIMDSARKLETEEVPIEQAYNRILAKDVTSDMDMPPFDKSAMDGYACRREDLGNELAVLEEIPAGYVPRRTISRNECAKIMTGGMVPEGADCVIMVEHTKKITDSTIVFTGKETKGNIRPKAHHVKKGSVVLARGAKLTVPRIAVAASYGCAIPLVSRRPKVGIIATGNELVEPHEKPPFSKIRNSNGYQICAHVASAGAVPTYYGIARDTEQSLDGMIKTVKAANDVIIMSGGVSMGDYDLVPGLLEKNGFRLLFERVEIKPGRPTVFGVSDEAFCFGLPGNPVSTFVTFELLVKPFLYKLMGHTFRPPFMPMLLDHDLTRKKADRTAWIPVVFTDNGGVAAIEYHGSDHIHSLSKADGMICIPMGITEIKKGTTVHVRSIQS